MSVTRSLLPNWNRNCLAHLIWHIVAVTVLVIRRICLQGSPILAKKTHEHCRKLSSITPPLVHDETELYQNRCALHRLAKTLDAPLATSRPSLKGEQEDKAWSATANEQKKTSSYCKTHLALLCRATFDPCCCK
jgi:hypothetical protein